MEIVHIAAEMAPIAKVGGLGDVLHGLPRGLLAKKHDVQVVLPKYDTLNLNEVKNLEVIDTELPAFFEGSWALNTVWRGAVDSIPVIFIESHHPGQFFDRGKIYACEDDNDRFVYFCAAAAAYLLKFKSKVDIVHLHDWHTGLIAALLKERCPEIASKIVFTIHNLIYQGITDGSSLDKIGFKTQKMKEGDHYNLLKTGIAYADHVTTVSPNYAKEIVHTELGGSLRPTLKRYEEKFSGVLNGIDYGYWNPQTDPYLPVGFSAEKPAGKEKVKAELRHRLSLAEEDSPIVGAIARLVPQKGPEMLKAALLRTLEWGGQFVLLGSAPENNDSHKYFFNLKRKLAGSHHVHLELSYNEELSHLVYGGSDLFLVPSVFEPCGLTQMIAMRYGSLPLVRLTGGLADTVIEGQNGFTFVEPTAEGILAALDRALEAWYQNRSLWKSLQDAAMHTDFSWAHPADQYLTIYRSLLKAHA